MRTMSLIESDFLQKLSGVDSKQEEYVLLNLLKSISLEELINMFNTVRLNCDKLIQIANLSYSHPNGFDKIVLIHNQLFGLRLHVWWQLKGFIESNNDIHNHRWNFATKLIKGSYNSEIYKSSTDGLAYNYFVYHHKENRIFLEKKYISSLELVSSQIMHETESYSQASNVLHRISAFSVPIITLFLHGRKTVLQTDVFRKQSDLNYEAASPISYFTPQTLSETLDAVCYNLNYGQ